MVKQELKRPSGREHLNTANVENQRLREKLERMTRPVIESEWFSVVQGGYRRGWDACTDILAARSRDEQP